MSSDNEHDQLPADEQNELNPRHKRPIQETELSGGEDFVDISHDEGAKAVQPVLGIAEAVVNISSSLSRYQLKIYILAVSTLNVLFQSIEKKDFKDVFYLLEEKMPTEAVSMTMESLSRLGKNFTGLLQPLVKDTFVIQKHYDTDFVLTLGVILRDISEDEYKSFMELARRVYFNEIHPDKLKDPAKLVGKLLGDGKAEEKDLHNYFKWIALADCHSQLKVLKEFCQRHGKEVPAELNYKEGEQQGGGDGDNKQLKDGTNKPVEEEDSHDNMYINNSEATPLLRNSQHPLSSNNILNNKLKLMCALLLVLVFMTVGLVPPILYELFTTKLTSINPPQSTQALQDDYVLLPYSIHSGTMFQYTLSFSLQVPFNRTTNVDIYCVEPDQLPSVKRKDNFASSKVPFLADKTYFNTCQYPGKCILGQFIYQAKTSVSALIFDITLNNFNASTYVNASIFDNFDDVQNFLHDKQQYNMVKNTRLNQQIFRLILEEPQMRGSSYYFIVLEDVVRTSSWFTVQPSGLHVYYNASSHPVCCTMNTTNNYTCSFTGIRHDSVTYLARVRGDKVRGIPTENQLFYITSSVSDPLPTDIGRRIVWGSYSVMVIITVVLIAAVFIIKRVCPVLKRPQSHVAAI